MSGSFLYVCDTDEMAWLATLTCLVAPLLNAICQRLNVPASATPKTHTICDLRGVLSPVSTSGQTYRRLSWSAQTAQRPGSTEGTSPVSLRTLAGFHGPELALYRDGRSAPAHFCVEGPGHTGQTISGQKNREV